MIIGKKRRKNSTQDLNQGPLELQVRYNCTTMYTVSGYHSNTISSISPNQRRQSKFPRVKSLVLIHSTCPYKNYVPKYSQTPHELFFYHSVIRSINKIQILSFFSFTSRLSRSIIQLLVAWNEQQDCAGHFGPWTFISCNDKLHKYTGIYIAYL